MTWVAVAIGGSAVLGYMGASKQAGAAQSAAAGQADAARYAAEQQRQMFDIINEQQKPYREAGYGALTRIGELLPGLTAPVSREEIMGLPGYQFGIEQGTGAARQMMNVGGGGSNVDRAAQKFAVDYTLGTAMPQVIAQRQNIYNTLAGIAGIGQTGQTQINQAGMNAAGNIGQAAIGGATALGAGQVGAANAMAGAYGNIGNAGMMYSFLNRPSAATGANAMGPVYGQQPLGSSFAPFQVG
jgi:hypothetical protein